MSKIHNLSILVLAAMPRSGGNLLNEVLKLHPENLDLGEIFSPHRHVREACYRHALGDRKVPGPFKPDHLYTESEYLIAILHHARAIGKKGISLRLLDEHPLSAWAAIRGNNFAGARLRVAVLRRRNPVNGLKSWLRAIHSGIWHAYTVEQRNAARANGGPEREFDERNIADWLWRDERLPAMARVMGVSHTTIWFEDLCERYKQTVENLFCFAGLSAMAAPEAPTFRLTEETK